MSANPPASEEGVQVMRKIPRRHSHMADDGIHAHTHQTCITRTTTTGQTLGRVSAWVCEQISSSEHERETVSDSRREGKQIQEGVRDRECEFGFLCWGGMLVSKVNENALMGGEKRDGWTEAGNRETRDRMLH